MSTANRNTEAYCRVSRLSETIYFVGFLLTGTNVPVTDLYLLNGDFDFEPRTFIPFG